MHYRDLGESGPKVSIVGLGGNDFGTGFDAALADANRMIELGSNDPLAYALRGLIHCARGDIDLARADWDMARSLTDDPAARAELDALIAAPAC